MDDSIWDSGESGELAETCSKVATGKYNLSASVTRDRYRCHLGRLTLSYGCKTWFKVDSLKFKVSLGS